MTWTIAAFIIAAFFAMNIGASGTAAAMGPAYGSGAVKTKKAALYIVALGVFLGALAGGEVVKTIGGGIIPSDIVTVKIVVLILGAATLSLFISNMLGIPLSTSEVTVGSLVGVGIAYQSLFMDKLIIIVSFWVLTPIASFVIAYCLGYVIKKSEQRWPQLTGSGKWRKWLAVLLVLAGFMESFAAGMNNVANAVGPLVGAGMLDVSHAVLAGGFFVALGAVLLGSRVLETNGKKITSLSLLQGTAVSTTGGSLVIVASIFGIPVPLTQVTTSAIVAIGTVDNGFRLWQKNIIRKIIKVWVVSPMFSLVVSYTLVQLVLEVDLYKLMVILSVFVATLGSISLAQATRRERRSYQDRGGGI